MGEPWVVLAHADGALPNLALMRLGTYFRERGANVVLVRANDRKRDVFPFGVPDRLRVLGSSIFAFFYMLVGFAPRETWEQIHHRFGKLVELGCKPYPMVYDQARRDLKAFQRWAVTGLYRAVPWASYRDPRLDVRPTS